MRMLDDDDVVEVALPDDVAVPRVLSVRPCEPEDRTTFVFVWTEPPTVSRDVLETETTISAGAPSTPVVD